MFEIYSLFRGIYLYETQFHGNKLNITLDCKLPFYQTYHCSHNLATNYTPLMTQNGGGIYGENLESFLLENSILSNLCSAMKGGAVYLLYQDSQSVCKCTLLKIIPIKLKR